MTFPFSVPVILIIQFLLLYLGVIVHPLATIFIPIGMVLLYFLVIHPEISLLLLMFTTVIKGYLLEVFPAISSIDLTIVLVALIWIGLSIKQLKGLIKIPQQLKEIFWLFTFFTILVVFSTFYTPSPNYGWLKSGRFAVITFTMFITPIILIRTIKESNILSRTYLYIISIITIFFIGKLIYVVVTGGLLGYLVRVTFLGINPIGPARVLSIGAGVALVYMFRNEKIEWIYGFIALLMIVGVITTGSRGPLLSFFAGGVIYLLLFEPVHRKKILLYTLIGVGIIVISLLLLPENLTYRFINISSSDYVITQTGVKRYSTIASRLDFWLMSFNTWIANLKNFCMGLGSGGFSSLFIWRDFRWYPHNIIIEIMVEFGIVGLIIISSFFYKSWQVIWNEKQWTLNPRIWIISTIIMFFSSLISGDINDNRMLWTLISISLATVSLEQNNIKHVSILT